MAAPLILCIDDNEDGLYLRKLVLEASGYSVLLATDGARGLELYADNLIAGVVLDYAMPGMNGGQVAAEMRRIKPDVPIILLSGCVSEMPPDALDVVDLFIAKGSPTVSLTQELKKRIPLPSASDRKLPQRQDLIEKAEQMIATSRGVARRTRQTVREGRRHLDSWSNRKKKE